MSLSLLFLHGWAFDAGVWRSMTPLLRGFPCVLSDRGYFGERSEPWAEGAFVMVAHSLGAMLALRQPLPECRGLVALNGFDRFSAGGDAPGVAPRVLDRMIARLDADPRRTAADFRARCGERASFPEPDKVRLAEDLLFLRDGDCRKEAGIVPFPVLSLQGGADPIMPDALRDVAFSRVARARHETRGDAGHLLPLTHAGWCAERIAAFAATLT